jgi:N-acetyl-1-D-myo-inositol-2-amino-2-deoxy-alpha-D-glucopyranoside deacetylase
MDVPRFLFVHAHPDDETLTTGATIAHYASRGAEVHVVTCTLGEEGEVIGDRWAQLAVDHADQLGGFRIGELTLALRQLGVAEPRFLGGAGRWRDSGMAETPGQHRHRFTDADLDDPVALLVDVITELRPHVVVTYDPNGGYGHPDHIRAHQVTMAAVTAASSTWQVPKVYWTVMSRSAADDALRRLAGAPLPPHWTSIPVSELPFCYDDEHIDAVVDAPESRQAKVAAMRAHDTQVTVAPGDEAFALSNGIALPLLHTEHFVLAAGAPGERDGRGWETDLLSGVNLG